MAGGAGDCAAVVQVEEERCEEEVSGYSTSRRCRKVPRQKCSITRQKVGHCGSLCVR